MSSAQEVLPPARVRQEWAADVRREPVVPWDPAGGWTRADLLRRCCAVAALPLAGALCLAAWTAEEASAVVLWGWVLVGPTTFYALARVLRPEPRSWERTPRHVLAGAGASFGLPVVAVLISMRATPEGGYAPVIFVVFGSAAFTLAVVTIVWALVAWVVRERRY